MISIANTTNNKKARNMHGINDFNLGKTFAISVSDSKTYTYLNSINFCEWKT